MSRIEEALEKAEKLRSAMFTVSEEKKSPREHVPPPMPGVALKITNQLLVSAGHLNTPAAEEYRKLKSAIVRLTKGDGFSNMLMVTSSIGNEGKSITALNLALSLAQEFDHTVLLIDADLRKPSVHSCLGIENKMGLTECLLDGVDVKDAMIRTGIGKLSLLTAGREVRNPAELFTSQRAREFFMELKNRYHDRYIIIDTPPVLPFAETRSLSAVVDGVVLVVKEGEVSLDKISETMECLRGTSLLGIVYNEAANYHSDSHQYYRQSYAI